MKAENAYPCGKKVAEVFFNDFDPTKEWYVHGFADKEGGLCEECKKRGVTAIRRRNEIFTCDTMLD